MPLFSVIVPVYKAEKTLDRCLKSILEQTLSDFEVILVDDGSPDGSGAMCDAYMKRDSRVRAVHKENGGPSSARNEGIDRATGDWIVFCDADDEMERDALEKYDRASRETGADVVIADISRIIGDTKTRYHLFANYFIFEREQDIDALTKATICYGLNPWPAPVPSRLGYGLPGNRTIRRAILEEHGIRFDPALRLMEDRIFHINVYARCRTIAYIPENVYFYYLTDGSLTNQYTKDLIVQNKAIIDAYHDLSDSLGKTEEWRDALNTMAVERLLAVFRQYVFHPLNTRSYKNCRTDVRDIALLDEYARALPNAILSALTGFERIVVRCIMKRRFGGVVLLYKARAILK